MGIYIDPIDGQTKESWLNEHGTLIKKTSLTDISIALAYSPSDTLPIVLVNNGMFTAAGVAYSLQELRRFLEPDGRRKKVYTVEISKILTAIPISTHSLIPSKSYISGP